jgi:myo-inositol-1(or 4)-monophosphatase
MEPPITVAAYLICAISVGLEYNGRIILGALNNPFSSEAYYASLGAGAFLNGQRINVSTEDKLEHGLYVAAFSSKIEDVGQYRAFGVLNDSSRGVLRIGSVAVALAYLACGRIDGLWGSKLHSWDLAAGPILVKEAGGVTTGVAGEEFALRGQSCVASNGSLHTDLIMTLQNGCFLEACK